MLRIIAASLVLVSTTAFADTLQYRNARYGTSAIMPADFYAWEPPANGDGRTFQHPEYKGMIRIYGSQNFAGDTVGDYRTYLTNLYKEEGMDITYKTGGKSWFVISGWSGNNIHYLRVEGCNEGPLHHMHFDFPGGEKSFWQPIIEEFAKSLDGPCG